MTWPLAVSTFTTADRLKIGWWLLRGKQWTAGPEVRKYEALWENYTGARHAIMVANGSVANELIALRRREELETAGEWPGKNSVIFPACTWVSSVSPWIRQGFMPVWCDISTNLCASTTSILAMLRQDTGRRIGTVFYTTLLGQADYMAELLQSCDAYGVRLMLDNCESSFSRTPEGVHFCALTTASTSFYFSHPATTGTEGGMIFCSDGDEADWYRMMRSHGMTRGMPHKYRNPDAHPAFDFYLPGTNYRSSDLQAYMGSLTFARSLEYSYQRMALANEFYRRLDHDRYTDITMGRCNNPLMALPIVPAPATRRSRDGVTTILDRLDIEHRPIVGGNLLRHTAFRSYGDARLYPRAEWVHDHGVYVGLHEGVKVEMVRELADELNR